jgi:phospholipid transport system substrate-binding protein
MARAKATLALWIACAALALPALAAADENGPRELVKRVTQEVLGEVRQQNGDQRKIISLVEDKVVPHFDFTAMTRIAAGRHWRDASPQQKKRLVDEFRKLLVHTYSGVLASYQHEKFEYPPLHASSGATDVTVTTRVLRPGSEPVRIDYEMEKTADGWKAYDVKVAGVSLVANYRSEFDAEVRKGGIEGLLKALEAKNKALENEPVGTKG